MKYIIITKKLWQEFNFKNLDKRFIVQNTINSKLIKKIKPKIIFFIHWSKLIPNNIYKNYPCIQFHTSDLPKFRGGSPIQNQIINDIKNTKITAFKVNSIIDGGEICLKKNIELSGSAQKIYINIEKKVIQMIFQIVKKKNLKFTKQYGKSSYYKRRKPEDSKINLDKIKSINNLYNLIRCTDADNYPKAYLSFKNFIVELFDAKLKNKILYAKIKVTKKK
jgi:methionyl-tRNA formyltransferase